MHSIRALAKRCVAYALFYSSTLSLYANARLRNRAVVLMYHRVLPEHTDSFSSAGITVTLKTFATNMAFLKKHFLPLSADQFRACLEHRQFPRRACLVTFDDGWSDNERHALPILLEHGVPAVVFVATGFIGTQKTFWQERLTRLLFHASRRPEFGKPILRELGVPEACDAGDAEARRIVRDLVTRLKSYSTAEIEGIMSRLTDALAHVEATASSIGGDTFMDWTAVVRLASTGRVTIGSHAHSHTPLTRLGRAGAAGELLQSRDAIERQGLPAPWICAYPNGDYDKDVTAAAELAGISVGFTTEPGYVEIDSDARRLPRMNIHESAASSQPEFLCRILGLF